MRELFLISARSVISVATDRKEGAVPIPVSEALEAQAVAAETKAADVRSPGRYLVSAVLAGAYIGVAVVLVVAATGPLLVGGSPWTKLIQGLVFGVALTLVIFAGAELSTGNMMTMTQGAFLRRNGVLVALVVIVFSFAGNLVGSALFGWLVHESGILGAAAPGKPAVGDVALATIVKGKMAESTTALFFRGVLCNFLVCLAVWTAARTRSDGAKLALIFWCLLAFISSGFEHVVANMTVFSLAMFEHVDGVTVGAFARNLLLVGLGNLVGGGLLVGASYAFTSRHVVTAPAAERILEAEPAA
ncbi:formate/nitrite transporter family protein [Actinomadura opuntiae]|uniref:formate/nitrite transporter family protein n=1 Tax=Actinomadura sp. OS1-43 TaxID=604315 RepID=UPI00255A824A|nr:formate/nitrite transporter family protein [Actinomadura sp. OS1-43]MDL4817217.1 formate/nitrite transporter family protein [Actinomadura sp. OS1-43]